MYALFQVGLGGFGRKAEVELDVECAGNHVGGAGAAVDVGNLEAGRGEIAVAFVPFGSGQLGQRGGCGVDGVVRQMRVGNVPLLAFYGEAT